MLTRETLFHCFDSVMTLFTTPHTFINLAFTLIFAVLLNIIEYDYEILSRILAEFFFNYDKIRPSRISTEILRQPPALLKNTSG